MRCQVQTEARPIIFTLECPSLISFLVENGVCCEINEIERTCTINTVEDRCACHLDNCKRNDNNVSVTKLNQSLEHQVDFINIFLQARLT